MSFDLYFCRQNGSLPTVPEIKEYFASLPCFQIHETDDDGVQFWYENDATGVYCDVSNENAMKVIGPLLDDFEVRNIRFKYLRPEKMAERCVASS